MKFTDVLAKTGRTDKNTAHTYGPWYDLWFERLRDLPLTILEVGVCVFGGGSVLSLAEYFHNATIWAVDIDRSRCSAEVFDHDRIVFLEADAYKRDWLIHLGREKLDIIIDDASHEVADQMKLLKMLRPKLKPDGFYVVEDCCTGHWLPRLPEVWSLGLKQTIIDMSNYKHYDNTLIRLDPNR